jgi:Kef-type K+ transport system membrane component KefB
MVLAEIAAILVAAKLAGELANHWGQPPVLGQLAAGVFLGFGFSLLNWPALEAAGVEVRQLADLGVIVLMFLAGLETDWDQLKATGRAAFVAACLGVVVPLAVGYAIGIGFGLGQVEALFVGVILTATSVSITAQTLMELGSLQTIAGATILGAAVIDDVIGLLVFSVAVVMTGTEQTNVPILAGGLGLFFLISVLAAPPAIAWTMRRADTLRGAEAALAIALAVALLYGFAAASAGLAAITGAYLAGLLINLHDGYGQLLDRVKVLAYGFFVPIFLVKTGMDARLDALGPALGFVVVATVVAIISKIVGCGLGARVSGLGTRQSLVVGVGMISRGEVALVVSSLALAAGVISQLVFSATVVVVLATTLVTPPLLRLVLRGEPAPTEQTAFASTDAA